MAASYRASLVTLSSASVSLCWFHGDLLLLNTMLCQMNLQSPPFLHSLPFNLSGHWQHSGSTSNKVQFKQSTGDNFKESKSLIRIFLLYIYGFLLYSVHLCMDGFLNQVLRNKKN